VADTSFTGSEVTIELSAAVGAALAGAGSLSGSGCSPTSFGFWFFGVNLRPQALHSRIRRAPIPIFYSAIPELSPEQ